MGAQQTLACRDVAGGCEVAVLVSAGSSRSGIQAIHGDALKIAVRSVPERGKANVEVEQVLAEFLRVPRKQVRVAAGHTSRRKRVRIAGLLRSHVTVLLQEAGFR